MAKKPDAYEYVRSYYRVPAYVGVKVTAKNGEKSGEIIRPRCPDQYVHVLFDGSRHAVPVHPDDLTYNIEAPHVQD